MRRVSLLLAASAYLGPPLWVYWPFASYDASSPGLKCGAAALAALCLAALASSVLSFSSVVFGIVAYERLPGLRLWGRKLELAALALPLLLCGAWLIAVSFTG